MAVCEDTDWGDAQDFYQYEVRSGTDGDVTKVVHPCGMPPR